MRARAAVLLGVLAACGGARPPAVAPAPAEPLAPPVGEPAPAAIPAPIPVAAAEPAPAPHAEPAPSGEAKPAATSPKSAGPRPTGKLRVFNIGMHIGGGPNDDETKAPIAKSVAPHFGALGACFDQLPTKKETDVGVDLLVPAEGGKAKVSHPRSTTPGSDPFLACVVRVFEGIDFQKPRGGRTVVSYSLRFAP